MSSMVTQSLDQKRRVIQRRLQVGRPDDKYEREADAVADQVMRMPSPDGIQMKPADGRPDIQMKCAKCEEEEKVQMKVTRTPKNPVYMSRQDEQKQNMAPGNVTKQLTGGGTSGQSLPQSINREMISKIGTDFSGVNIHTGASAVQMSRELGAKAFTYGNNIYFNQGQYDPASSAGKHLLAHELTHVVQQGHGAMIQMEEEEAATIGRSEDPCSYGDSDEKDREIHLNLGLRGIRVYERSGTSYRIAMQFNNIIVGPATRALASGNGWCHLYPVAGKQEYTSHGLINFVNYCGEFGFHSNYWRKFRDGERRIELIPGDQSAGCARIIDPTSVDNSSLARDFTESRRLYNFVRTNDCVRIYSRSSWREPTFSTCRSGANCDVS